MSQCVEGINDALDAIKVALDFVDRDGRSTVTLAVAGVRNEVASLHDLFECFRGATSGDLSPGVHALPEILLTDDRERLGNLAGRSAGVLLADLGLEDASQRIARTLVG